LLEAAGLPYVIENVKRAPLVDPITLCGASFGLRAMDAEGNLVLRRHRLFESNVSLVGKPCACRHWQSQGFKIAGCYGGARRTRHEAETIRHGGYVPSKPILENLMGIGWMTEAELFEAIPPAYTEFIGEQLIERLGDR
jgi:DNA (cytosine-5)-methyltransferase 1